MYGQIKKHLEDKRGIHDKKTQLFARERCINSCNETTFAERLLFW
jgi:hypothetical protein